MKKQTILTMLPVVTVVAVVCFAGGVMAIVSPQSTTYLEVSPVNDFEPSGMVGGPFAPSSMDYQLTNIGPNSLWWGVYKTVDWLNVEPDWGPLPPSQSVTVTVDLTAEANSLAEGIYTDTLTFVDISNDQQQTRTATLSVAMPGSLEVTPSEDFEPSGPMGGPFTPPSKEYQLTNIGGSSIDWHVDKTADWLDADPNEGVLDPCESTMITASLNVLADSLEDGVYTDTLTFTDVTNNQEQGRGVTLSIRSIWMAPGSFNIDTIEGCTLTETLTIGNNGIEDFDFMIRTRQVGTSGQAAGRIGSLLAAGEATVSSIPKGRDFTAVGDAPYEPGKLIVRFAPKASGKWRSRADKRQVLGSLGAAGRIKRDFIIVPGLSVVELPEGMTVEQALPLFNGANGILYAQPNYEVQICSTFPDDPRFSDLWGMHNTGQTGGTTDADIDAPEAWDIATGSSDIVVAVIDTGVGYTHPDLAANMWVNEAEYNGTPGVDDDGNGYVDDIYGYDFRNNDGDPMDDHYHGTHCAGTIGAVGNNGEGVAGVNWNVRIMAVKFLSSGGSGYTDDAIASVEYSTLMGANLSSNSWGGGSYSQGLKDAIEAAGAAGMLFVASAGNDSENTDVHPHYPSSYDSESLISVMSTEHNDNKSGFSNWGPISVDLGAPGSDILSCQLGGGYKYLSGTSMSSPHVAGACALLWSMNPAMSNEDVKNILLQTVDETLPGLCVSEGRLNLYNAILETKAPWLHIDPEAGTVGPADSIDISVTFDAMELIPGTYEAEIVILSNDPCSPRIVPVTMTVSPDDLVATPAEGFESSGTEGGPFEPQCMVYTLTNNGTESVNWTTSETEDWLGVDPWEGVLGPAETIDVNVCILPDADLLDPNLYTDILMFQNTNSGSIKPRPVTLIVKPPDCFTESFDDRGSDLSGLMVTFTPDGTIAYYEACRERVDEFPTDPCGGTYVGLWDDDFVEVVLSNDANVLFYGSRYDRFYIGSNGYITFGDGDTEFSGSLENHFNMPRISGMFADLDPPNDHCISYKKFGDRMVVTFQDVQLFGEKDAKCSFQIEMFYVDGTICITWLDIAESACIAGLSRGRGLPPVFFEESNLNMYPPCWPLCDFDRDYSVDMNDLAIFVSHWLDEDCNIPYWCGETDLDRSSTVGFGDFAICADNWLTEMEKWWLWPISHWEFDEGQGDIAYDSVGRNDGTIYGAQWTGGKIGDYALDFDGDNDCVDIGRPASLMNMGRATVAMWFKPNFTIDDTLGTWFSLFENNVDGAGVAGDTFLAFCPYSGYRGRLRLHIVTNTGQSFIIHSDSDFWPAGDWQHVAISWDNITGAMRMFVNGVEQADKIDDFTGVAMGADRDVTIGSNSEKNKYWWDGVIDEVAAWNRALSDEEIRQLYEEGRGSKAFAPNPTNGAIDVDPNTLLSWLPGKDANSHDVYFGTNYNDVNDATPDSNEYMGNYDVNSFDPCGLDLETTYYWRVDEVGDINAYKGDVWGFTTMYPVEPNLLSWWKFDEGQGGIAYDSAGDNDGTIYGAQWTGGKIGDYALDFDGDNDCVDIGRPASLMNMGRATIAMWFKPNFTIDDTLGRWFSIFEKNVDGAGVAGDTFLAFCPTPGYRGRLRLYIVNNTGQTFIINSDSDFWPAGDWQHVAVIWDNMTGAMRMFVNGVEQADKIDNFTGDAMGVDRDVTIGSNSEKNKYWWDGVIDEVTAWNRASSAEEIQQLYQAGLN